MLFIFFFFSFFGFSSSFIWSFIWRYVICKFKLLNLFILSFKLTILFCMSFLYSSSYTYNWWLISFNSSFNVCTSKMFSLHFWFSFKLFCSRWLILDINSSMSLNITWFKSRYLSNLLSIIDLREGDTRLLNTLIFLLRRGGENCFWEVAIILIRFLLNTVVLKLKFIIDLRWIVVRIGFTSMVRDRSMLAVIEVKNEGRVNVCSLTRIRKLRIFIFLSMSLFIFSILFIKRWLHINNSFLVSYSWFSISLSSFIFFRKKILYSSNLGIKSLVNRL